ncbi:alpha/beta hydrolase [Nocardioides currus]|uniref:alpha/beta hydrolase n=1 Tax=Nocardioides currus TaxID=2133958 RepID=UPI000DF14BC3|nr:alpha/beta hydrolase [Nocardioides currus]
MTFGGLPTRWEPDGPSRGLALVLPGRAYSPSAPLLELARQVLLQHGFTVQQVWWDAAARTDAELAEPEPWVRRQVESALASESSDPVLLVAKSLGTHAASYAAERGIDSIWLTPLLVVPEQAGAIAANEGRQLLVGGLADELWDARVAAELAETGCDVLEVADADHGMATSDAVRTAEILVEVARATDAFVRSLDRDR